MFKILARSGDFPLTRGVATVVNSFILAAMLLGITFSSVADPPFSTDVRVSPNGAGSGIWGGYRLLSTAAAPDGTIYVVWQDTRIFPPLDADIYFSRSLDGGKTFSYEKKINDTPSGVNDHNPVIDVDGRGNVYVVWYSFAWAGAGVHFIKSEDGGDTFSKRIRIDDPLGYGGRPDIYVDSKGFINVAYEGGWGDVDIYFTRSTDGGVTWGDGIRNSNDVKISDPQNASLQSSPRLAADLDGNLNVAWVDAREGGSNWDTYFSRSTDGGKTFSSNIRLNDDIPIENEQSNVDISTGENGEIYVVSRTLGSTRKGIYFYKSTDGGVTFNDGLENDNDPMIADRSPMNFRIASIDTDASGRINVVYEGDNHIFYTNSTDEGDSFGDGIPDTDPRVPDVTGSDRFLPELDVDSCGNVHVFWMDTRNGQNDVYASTLGNLSTDLSVFDYELNLVPSERVVLGSSLNLSSIVHNYCAQFVPQTSVRFFLGEPSLGQQIGSDHAITGLDPLGGSSYANLTWVPTSIGVHKLCVFVDPDDDIEEFNERNNIACGNVEVLPPPRPPKNLDAHLSGWKFQDVTLNWTLSPDDGTGFGSVERYLLYRGETYSANRIGYQLLASIPSGNDSHVDVDAGDGDPSDYFYYVCASPSFNASACGPNQAGKFTRSLSQGPNLVSIPLIQSDESIETVLQTVKYNKAWYYDSSSLEWKWYMKFKGYGKGLWNVNHTMGTWVNVTGDSNLTVAGIVPAQTMIHLYEGWNVISFPSFNSSYTAHDLKMNTGAVRLEGYDPAPPYHLRMLSDVDVLQAGEAYWVKLKADTDWIIKIA